MLMRAFQLLLLVCLLTGTRRFELSPDLKTLTVTVRQVGQSKPQSILVFERE